MTNKTGYVSSMSSWWMTNAAMTGDTPLGRDYAKVLMQQFKNHFPREERVVIMPYVFAWNQQNKPPLPRDFIMSLLDIEPEKTKRPNKADPSAFAVKLFDIE